MKSSQRQPAHFFRMLREIEQPKKIDLKNEAYKKNGKHYSDWKRGLLWLHKMMCNARI